jgi:hypothetical protein
MLNEADDLEPPKGTGVINVKHGSLNRIILLGSLLLAVVIANGCADPQNSNQENDNSFTNFTTDYGQILSQMSTELGDHYDGMMNGDMSGMMSSIASMMTDYHTIMSNDLHTMKKDIGEMRDYCNSHGMDDDHFWSDMQDLHDSCQQEMEEHFQEMMDMMDAAGMMGQNMSQSMLDEMNERRSLMTQYLATMNGCHEWMMQYDSQQH